MHLSEGSIYIRMFVTISSESASFILCRQGVQSALPGGEARDH